MVWAVALSTMDLITHCLTPMNHIYGIRSLSEFGNPGWAPRPNSALPPRCFHEAIPKYISERTSYLQVRLEFHRYPHLIRSLFNVSRFGPPSSVTWTSAWTWVDHLVSGLRRYTVAPCSDSLSLRLRILCLTLHEISNSPVHSTKGTPSLVIDSEEKTNGALTTCRHTVSGSISLPFRGAFHLSLTVLVHYRSLGSI